MAEQVSANLSCLTTTYYGALHASQLHAFYERSVIQAYGSDLMTSWLSSNSIVRTRPAPTFNHYEVDRLNMPITTSGGSGAPGASVVLTITGGYTGAGVYDPTQVGYSIFQASTGNTYVITAKSEAVVGAHTITITPPNATVAISIAAGEQLVMIPMVLVAQCSCASNNSMRGDGVLFTNTMQEVRRDLCICGEALASFSKGVTFFDIVNPATGRSDGYWYNAEIGRVETEFRMAEEMALLIGQQYTNTTLTALGYRGSLGVIPTILAYGNTKNYAAGAGFQLSDIDDMDIVMEKNNSPAEYMWYGGIELNKQVIKVIKDYFPNGAVTYDTFGGSKDNALRWGFSSYGTSFGRTHHFHNMKIFNAPNYLGVAGGNYIGSAIVFPGSKMRNSDGEDVNYIERVHLAGNGFDYGYDHFYVDGTGLFNKSDSRATNCRQVTFSWADMVGVEIFAAKQLFYVQRA